MSDNVSSQWLRYIPHMFSHHVIQQWQKFLQEVVRISRCNLAIRGMDVDLLYCWVPLFFHSYPSTCHRLPQGCGARKMCLPVQDVQGWRDSQMAPSMSCRNRWMGAASYSKFLAFFWHMSCCHGSAWCSCWCIGKPGHQFPKCGCWRSGALERTKGWLEQGATMCYIIRHHSGLQQLVIGHFESHDPVRIVGW